jgi:4'-phosphopantetheinyl transferase
MPIEWRSVHSLLPLEADEAQVWRVELADAAGLLHTYAPLLTVEEHDRAERLRSGQVREQFLIGRACLRILLGNALGVDACQVPIQSGPNGKPGTPVIGDQSISFNIAHSHGTILIALRRQGAVGVDVEHINRATEIMDIAQSSFTAEETARLAGCAEEEERRQAFYRCWTQKEAVVKADGRGLAMPLSAFEVPVDPASSSPVTVQGPSNGSSTIYLVSDLSLGDGIAGAIALESPDCRLSLLTFPLASSVYHFR